MSLHPDDIPYGGVDWLGCEQIQRINTEARAGTRAIAVAGAAMAFASFLCLDARGNPHMPELPKAVSDFIEGFVDLRPTQQVPLGMTLPTESPNPWNNLTL